MYIENEEMNRSRQVAQADGRELSPETPSFGPPAGSAPLSPETPSFGPPAGSAPLSPETPSFGPPAGNAPLSPETPSFGPPAGGIGGVIIVPGQTVNPGCGQGQSTNIRFLHAAPGQSAVNVRLGNRTVINNLQFGNVTPYYLESGGRRILITVTNTRTGAILYREYFYFDCRSAYTVAIAQNGTRISLYVLTDEPCNQTNYGCVRAANLSPNSGAVDVFLSGYGRIFQNVAQYSYTGYRRMSQGVYRALVSEALPCTNDGDVVIAEGYVECNNTRIAILETATFRVMKGVAYTLYIIGLANQFPSLQILPLESDLIY